MIHGHHLHLNLGEVAFYDAGLGKGRARHKEMSLDPGLWILAKQSVLKKKNYERKSKILLVARTRSLNLR